MRFLNLFLVLICFYSYSDPLVRFDKENIELTIQLNNKLSGTDWIYIWRGKHYPIRFESNGTISKLDSWSQVKWVVTGKNEVVLEGISDRMVLLFDLQLNSFTTVDWDGQRSSGRRINKN